MLDVLLDAQPGHPGVGWLNEDGAHEMYLVANDGVIDVESLRPTVTLTVTPTGEILSSLQFGRWYLRQSDRG